MEAQRADNHGRLKGEPCVLDDYRHSSILVDAGAGDQLRNGRGSFTFLPVVVLIGIVEEQQPT